MSVLDEIGEIKPTGRIKYLVARKDGSVEHVEGEQAKSEAELPQVGDGKIINGVGTEIRGIARTPHLPFTWHIVAAEH